MSTTRHQRRKRAKANALDKLERLAIAERSRRNAEIVRRNLSTRPDRNYYAGIRSSAVLIVEGGAIRGGFQKTRLARK